MQISLECSDVRAALNGIAVLVYKCLLTLLIPRVNARQCRVPRHRRLRLRLHHLLSLKFPQSETKTQGQLAWYKQGRTSLHTLHTHTHLH